jgi:hypothetical protein
VNDRLGAFADRLAVELAPRVAALVVEQLGNDADRHEPNNGRPLTTAEVAARIGRSEDFCREHRAELGGFPLGPTGEGKRPRLGFDPRRVEAFARGGDPEPGLDPAQRAPARRSRLSEADLLPIRSERS